jgi:5'-methylthioadenosine phosphorylase
VSEARATGAFGGSGFYATLDDVEELAVDTPYGPPSDRLAIGTLDGTRVAFLPRHGRRHHVPPHTVARLRDRLFAAIPAAGRQPAGDPCRDAPVGTGQ